VLIPKIVITLKDGKVFEVHSTLSSDVAILDMTHDWSEDEKTKWSNTCAQLVRVYGKGKK
jgi:hypothetical protein